ncbi:ribonuclease Y, partial [bacterium]|nr:ribonuclease Y [bacterium]
ARSEIDKLKSDVEREREELRTKHQIDEKRLAQREEGLTSKDQQLATREQWISNQEQRLIAQEKRLDDIESTLKARQAEVAQSKDLLREALERNAQLTTSEARAELFSQVERDCQLVLARRVREAEQRAKEEADRKARSIITLAIQRWASEQVMESTISVVNLPSDEMKGRIIGREGRNIRMLENLTGIDLIIDDTPEAVILSGFDPIRREVARMALEKLVSDGRIHPTKIEEMVGVSRRELEESIVQAGNSAAVAVGVTGLHPELIKLLGRLRFRTSYGQNVLSHSLEVSLLCAHMAAELGADVQVCARAGLLHDIGKATTSEVEGAHAVIGARLCEKYGELPAVVHCVEAHHEDVEMLTVEAMLVQAADAVSAARPGARRENVETYVKRIEKLEKVAASFEGVEQAFAVQAGREIRIVVRPEIVDDLRASRLANQIAARIEEELQYPGQIKVTVVRETRFHQYAN